MPSRRTLLLADDSPTVQKVVSLTFADQDFEVLTASGGEEALAKLGEVVPDVLLADVHMPSPNGYELCARVKRDPRTARVPVLLLVGTFEEPLNEAEARACGADGVLTKPFQSIRDLVSKVGGLIGGHSEQSKAAVAERDEREAPPAAAFDAVTDARASSAPAAEEVQPHPAFAGFDADDESIESVSADDFVAAGRARAEDAAAEFVTADAPLARASSGDAFAQRADDAERRTAGAVEQVEPVEVAAEASPLAAEAPSPFAAEASPVASVAEASVFGAAAGGRGPSGYAAARFSPPQAEAGFAARAPLPVADDSLLELGELTSPRAHAAADADDLILDIEDEEDVPVARAEASDSAGLFDPAGASGANASREAADASGAGRVEAESLAETAEASAEPAAEISPANLSSAWSDVPPVEATPAPPVFAESESASETIEPELEIEAEAAHVAEPPAAHVAESSSSVDAEAFESQDAPAVAASAATSAEVAETQAARAEVAGARVDDAVGASQLSPEMVEAIARRVVELMSDRAVREIAWEVVPDLAERLIRERLEQESTRHGESVNR